MMRLPLIPGLAVLFALVVPPAHPAARAATDVGSQLPGAALAAALGCGGCHAGLVDSELPGRAPAFGPGAEPLSGEFVFTYLADPVTRRPELAPARMPDFGLAEDERLALALFLAGDGDGPSVAAARERFPEITAEDGRLLFEGMGCRGCHEDSRVAADGARGVGPDLASAGERYRGEWIAGYLAAPVPVRPAGHRPGTGSRMPDFRLEPDEVELLSGYLESLRAGPGPATLAAEAGGAPLPSERPSAWALHRAETFLTDRLSCLGCHSWRGEGGRIGPELDGLPDRLTPEAIAAAVHAPIRARAGSVMPPSPFRTGILDGVVALLATDSTSWTGAERPELPWGERRGILEAWAGEGSGALEATPPSPAPGAGEVLYRRRCAACHGVAGNGAGFNREWLPVPATAHADAAAMSLRPDDTLYDGIASGGWVLDRSHRMPAFGQALDRDRIRSLVAYIRELCDCQGPAWAQGGAER